MSNKPQLAKGTRDFGPVQVAKRKYILQVIETVFVKYGFMPIETPAMENLQTLMGKYGDEGDTLLFKILNSGNYFKDLIEYNNKGLAHEEFDSTFLPSFSGKVNDLDAKNSLRLMAEKGLRYDLTVPFARYVVMNQNDITFPFKRYQMQPVWRADKPQKGRYREFWQCDADVVGSNSLIFETELVQIYHEVFATLGLNNYSLKINNRKLLNGIAECLGITDKFSEFTVVLDKLDKIGSDNVVKELIEKNILTSADKINQFIAIVNNKTSNQQLLDDLADFGLGLSTIGMQGLNELNEVLSNLHAFNQTINISVEPTLARGLSYYTGSIFEVVNTTGSLKSSIAGGGRYDNLTGIFGLPNVSGVGISFGLDRIYDVLEELKLFPTALNQSFTKVLFCCFGSAEIKYALPLVNKLRLKNIAAEIYPEPAKMKKQLGYADAKQIPFAIIIGEDEMQSDILTLKNLLSGEQQKLPFTEIENFLNTH